MTAPRRTPLLLLAGLAAGLIPACLQVHGTVTPVEQPPANPPPSREFATLPSRPGEVIPANPAAKAVAKTQPAAKPDPAVGQVTSQRPGPAAKDEPPPPDVPVVPAKAAEPGQLPILPGPPSTTPEPPLLAAMRDYAEGRPDRAIEHLKGLDKANQEFVLAVMPVLVRGAQMNLAAPDPAEAAVVSDQLQAVASRLEAKSALKIERVVFCRQSRGFGLYDPWPEAQPYRPSDLAVLYTEIRHVPSEPAVGPKGEGFVSRLVVTLEVRNANGVLVEQIDPADYRRWSAVARYDHVDFSRSPLRDYSRTYRMVVPAQPGVYTVTVEVKDPVTGRTARSQPAEFRVAGP